MSQRDNPLEQGPSRRELEREWPSGMIDSMLAEGFVFGYVNEHRCSLRWRWTCRICWPRVGRVGQRIWDWNQQRKRR